MSKGGIDDLPLLVKKRLAIYFWNTGGKAYKLQPSSWQIPLPPPELTGTSATDQENYAKWLRQFLIYSAHAQQRGRIVRTADELILPADLINELNNVDLWPPPIEPLPPSIEEWLKKYRKYRENGWYYYPGVTIPPRFEKVAVTVIDELKKDYEHDAALYLGAVGDVRVHPDLIDLANDSDMIPPYGSRANPIPSTRAKRF
ncbi:hypothetical protein [Haliangium sp. UPWRP_2]|uniref:hypothetical protein n=1 Tax=Haliangium sp. UPWRP_2 TaxID=1931276 RepID=UPI001E3A2238|nr:hypothetical protein [Haliangium sp. UPWRP_2]